MKTTRILLVIVCAVSLGISACKKDNSNNTITYQGTPPAFLKVGHEWRYQATPNFGDVDTFIYKVESLNSSNEYVMSFKSTTNGTGTYLWFMDGTGLKQYNNGADKSKATLLWKTDAKLNDSWTTFTSANPTKATEHDSITTFNEPVATLAGNLNASGVYITFSDAFNSQTSYWSNDLGQVYIDNPFLIQLDLFYKNF